MHYKIEANGIDMGIWEGATAREAIEAMWRDAGYGEPWDPELCRADELTVREAVGPHTVITTNNAYDSILLVDTEDRVLSAWQATKNTVADYLDTGADAVAWESDVWDGFPVSAGTPRTIGAFGEECGRDGQIMDDSRREFWGRICGQHCACGTITGEAGSARSLGRGQPAQVLPTRRAACS